ncbi:MAG: hypothetical protein HC894_21810 [Microcoleus sp. SM1_3_4]|nr:hypothetical protein [Microcoleus sp. SM1_3_4]
MSFELKIESGSIGVSIQLSAISRQLKTHLIVRSSPIASWIAIGDGSHSSIIQITQPVKA